ncbi:putative reverse transcriptase domain-containing protein [Tanacetum coccineum]
MIPLQGLVTTLQGQVTALQGQVMALQGQVTALQGQQGPAGGPAQPELPEEAVRDATKNGVGSHTSGTGVRGSERVAQECTYQDFMKCKPLYFKGTEGVVELTQWFERMETAGSLTWWNSIVILVTHDVAYAMTWVDLRKKMTDKYCLRNEMKKLEAELWNLKVIGTDVVRYNQCFQELALLYVRMFPEESDKIERYVGGLPDMIYGNVVASKPKTMQEAVEMATELIDKRVSTIAERQAENKRKSEGNANNTNNQKGTGSGKNTAPAKVYAVGRAGTNLDSNVVMGTFLLNNRYASVLFDTGADRSFMSTAFSSQMDIMPSTLDHYYDVELAGRGR